MSEAKRLRLSTREAMAFIGVGSPNTLRTYRLNEGFPEPVKMSSKPNGKAFYYQDEIEKWLKDRRSVA